MIDRKQIFLSYIVDVVRRKFFGFQDFVDELYVDGVIIGMYFFWFFWGRELYVFFYYLVVYLWIFVINVVGFYRIEFDFFVSFYVDICS